MCIMTKFYMLMLVLLIIAIINLVRALRENKSKNKVIDIATNAVAVTLLSIALLIDLLQ